MSLFQSTRPRGARLHHLHHRAIAPGCFNPRARVGRDHFHNPTSSRFFSFNPRARVGRDGDCIFAGCPVHVSIHAPAWGATIEPYLSADVVAVSIHAPAWGATGMPVASCTSRMFQSTRPRGARHHALL
ncbi:conserved hypothetical protein [Pelodictyon luteolum DSM 273]|nr:conserved hypothetical protein [Pelodictyon luteolum DSM 273]